MATAKPTSSSRVSPLARRAASRATIWASLARPASSSSIAASASRRGRWRPASTVRIASLITDLWSTLSFENAGRGAPCNLLALGVQSKLPRFDRTQILALFTPSTLRRANRWSLDEDSRIPGQGHFGAVRRADPPWRGGVYHGTGASRDRAPGRAGGCGQGADPRRRARQSRRGEAGSLGRRSGRSCRQDAGDETGDAANRSRGAHRQTAAD